MAAKKKAPAKKVVTKKASGVSPTPPPPKGPDWQAKPYPPTPPMPKRTGPETGSWMGPLTPQLVDGGALRAQGRAVARAQRELEKQKKKLKGMQPKNVYDSSKQPSSSPNRPQKPNSGPAPKPKKPKKPKWGPGDSGGTRGLPGYWE